MVITKKVSALILALGCFSTLLACYEPHTTKRNLIAVHAVSRPVQKQIKVALLLDTSNSMDGLINQAKARLWDIVNELSYARCDGYAPNFKIALYEYGNDGLPSSEGYIRQVTGFTDDLDEISEKLFSLTTNGGNEFCGQVIMSSLGQLDWGSNPDDLKMIFIAGNEPFTQGPAHYEDAAAQAKEKNVIVNTIFCGDRDHGIQGKWQQGAVLTGGDYMTIDHNALIVEIKTPYDAQIIQLNEKLNKTYVPYGKKGTQKARMQAEQDVNAASINNEIQLKRAVSKSSTLYKNSSWDLVDASKEKGFAYETLEETDLPEKLKGKSSVEIRKYVSEMAKEREEIQKQIQALNSKRETYIVTQNRKSTSKGLESAMIKAIKKQAALKNYIWD